MEFVSRIKTLLIFGLARSPFKEACAEFLGTFFLVVCGDGVMAAITLGRIGHNASIVSSFGWGLALVIGVSIAGGISGGHLNPAVSVALATVRKCRWKNVLSYIIAHYLSSFLAAAVVYSVYADAIKEFDNGLRQMPPELNSTAQIFSTFPQDFASIGSCFIDQVVGTALLLLVICAATDVKNLRLPPHIQPAIIGLGLTAVCLAFGHNCGAPLNPARDLSPRIFTAISGWGWKVFSYRSYTWFWVPVVAPHVGAILGVWLYEFFIDMPFRNYGVLLDDIETLERNRDERVRKCAVTPSSHLPTHVSPSSEYFGRTSMDKSSIENERSAEGLRKAKPDSSPQP